MLNDDGLLADMESAGDLGFGIAWPDPKRPGTLRQPSWMQRAKPSPVKLGLIHTLPQWVTNSRTLSPTCGAARPRPLCSLMRRNISWIALPSITKSDRQTTRSQESGKVVIWSDTPGFLSAWA